MSGPSFAEFLLLCVIGLIVLGPKRLPEVASQVGKWIGQARRMTRVMKRQLEEELDLEKKLDIEPILHPQPNDDDTYSPLHTQPPDSVAGVKLKDDEPEPEDEHDDSDLDVDTDDEDEDLEQAGKA